MKLPVARVAFALVFPLAGIAAPDFPAHGFKSSLPASVKWDLRHQYDDAVHDVVMRTYTNDAGGYVITLLLGKNSTNEKKLGPIADRFTQQLATKPGFRIIAERTGQLGGVPARLLTAELESGTGVRHYFAALALKGEKLYTCTFVSSAKKVEEDEVLVEFLNSIAISK
ncbi:MAG TPA: hypothetical protein VHO24_16335 [Opitutaceae bacterium]|nr:hypothetical protein [Opitutaceae bacterium]